ncbi:hypothetical protein BGZ65_002829 [Modicella reniformis]|uniref:GPN-loop GTPase n=1 Tax=Modicella reniformis TaxID=1440133 RepID=A0A9P6STY6_9FUNG|nr:hypothetical protein BGZ65_002829 [Modicella reniformis]
MYSSLLEAKVVILGSQNVGKTSLVVRYVQKTFSTNYSSTIGASFMTKKLAVDNCKVRLQIWDTAGQERFRSMAPMYYRGANAAILVYDITSEDSFQDMNSWINELRKNMTEELIIHVVGNKLDLAPKMRAIPLSRTLEYVSDTLGPDCSVHEVSAKDDDGIEELFLQITRKLVEKKQEIERIKRINAENAITLQQLEDERLQQAQSSNNSSVYILVDTPGQIEIFTWSASGSIITDTLAASYPTMVAYIIDTPRTASPTTFMSNMLYACSILYKTKVPFILVFNKIDVKSHHFAMEWMTDFEIFQEALKRDTSYMSSLMNSMSLVLDEFYAHLKVVGVSAVTGAGMDDFLKAVDQAVIEYDQEYKPELERVLREREKKKELDKKEQMTRLMKDMAMEEKGQEVRFGKGPRKSKDDKDEEEEEDEDDGFGEYERRPRYRRDDQDSDDEDITAWRKDMEERQARTEDESFQRFISGQRLE